MSLSCLEEREACRGGPISNTSDPSDLSDFLEGEESRLAGLLSLTPDLGVRHFLEEEGEEEGEKRLSKLLLFKSLL